jgi:hypothetical protein
MSRKRLALVAINSFSFRFLSESGILAQLCQSPGLHCAMISPNPAHQAYLADLPSAQAQWHRLNQPHSDLSILPPRRLPERAWAYLHRLLRAGPLRKRAEFANLYYRFSEIHQFVRFLDRKHFSPEKKRFEETRAVFLDEAYGRPFPKSERVFKWLYDFHYAPWQVPDMYVEAFFEAYQPDAVVLLHVQNTMVKPYALAAQKRGIPLLGLVASWDQPSLSGPMVPGIDRYLVASRMMRDHLQKFHQVAPEKVDLIGWPQLDVYHQPEKLLSREAFLESLKLPPDHKLLLWASYPTHWVAYEPSILAHVVAQVKAGAYGDNMSLIIRPHPLDNQAERLKAYEHFPQVIVESPELGRLDHLINLLRHAAAMIAPASTITLDASVADTPLINIAWDGEAQVSPMESCERWYLADHYREVVQTGGVSLAKSYEQLDQMILGYLQDPKAHAEGRARLREYLVEPCDGQSAGRFVQALQAALASF